MLAVRPSPAPPLSPSLQRRKIVTGEYEPTEEECQWSDDSEEKDGQF